MAREAGRGQIRDRPREPLRTLGSPLGVQPTLDTQLLNITKWGWEGTGRDRP